MKKNILFITLILIANAFGLTGMAATSSKFPEEGESKQKDLPEKKMIDGKWYFSYKVVAGDTWYGIARKSGITYAELRMANKKSDDSLVPGMDILIPADKLKPNDPFFRKNYFDENPKEEIKGEIKYHVVEKSQTLFSISKMYKVSVEDIKDWNHLPSNTISTGDKLIVSGTRETKNKVREQNQIVETKKVVPSKNIKKETPESGIKSDKKKSTERKNDIPEATGAANKTGEVISAEDKTSASGSKIVFANNRRKIEETGMAGWQDDGNKDEEVYYALHKSAPEGTIIWVLNMDNSKQIYVKVTGKLPDEQIKDGLILSISKAGANKLEVTEKKFLVSLIYGVDKE